MRSVFCVAATNIKKSPVSCNITSAEGFDADLNDLSPYESESKQKECHIVLEASSLHLALQRLLYSSECYGTSEIMSASIDCKLSLY